MDKTCLHCRKVKLLEDFYKQSSKKDGRQNYCKICDTKLALIRQKQASDREKRKEWQSNNKWRMNSNNQKWKDKNREHVRDYANSYYLENKEKVDKNKIIQKEKYPNIYKARNKVTNAIRLGRLKKIPCEYGECKQIKVEAHHSNYDKPLDVVWFCSHHHAIADKVKRIKDYFLIKSFGT